MKWAWSEGSYWLLHERDFPAADQVVETLNLGIELRQDPQGKIWAAISNPERHAMNESYIPPSWKDAHQVCEALVQDVRTLHRYGFRLGVFRFDKRNRMKVLPAEQIVSVVRQLDGKPLLHGLEPDWKAGFQPLTYDPDAVPWISLRKRMLRGWQSCVRRPWKKLLIESLWSAELVGDASALVDWHVIVQTIYFLQSMARSRGNYDLSRMTVSRQAQLQRGIVPAIMCRLLCWKSPLLLFWKLGPQPFGGYRYWLRRLERKVQELKFRPHRWQETMPPSINPN